MASIIKSYDKRSGITYVYKSVSYWDKEKKAPRCHRKLIGKIDPKTGDIIPTNGTQRHRSLNLPEIERIPDEQTVPNGEGICNRNLVNELKQLIQQDKEYLNQVEKEVKERRAELDVIERNIYKYEYNQ